MACELVLEQRVEVLRRSIGDRRDQREPRRIDDSPCPHSLRRAPPVEGQFDQIARLVGHTGGSTVTEQIYRKQIRPVIDDGATAMNRLFRDEAG